MQHAIHLRDTACGFLLIGLFLRTILPRRTTNPEHPADNSWYTYFRGPARKKLLEEGGRVLSAFFLYSGFFLLIIAFL